jgi:hypothetical protein
MAAAGLWTTPTDLAKHVIALQRMNRGEFRYLSPQLTHAMLTPGANNQGLGPGISADGLRFRHDGADEGFQAVMTGFLDGRGGVVIMTNSDNGFQLADELRLTIGALYGWPGMVPIERTVVAISVAALDGLTGKYATPSDQDDGTTEDLEVTREDDTLAVTLHGVREMTLLPESPTKFFDRESDTPVEFFLVGKTAKVLIGGRRQGVRHQ